VSLSGDGGDELFGGYNRYVWVTKIWNSIGWIPHPLRRGIVAGLMRVPPSRWNTIIRRFSQWLPANWRYGDPGDKLHKLAEVLDARSGEEIYWRLVSHWKQPAELVTDASEPETVLTDRVRWPKVADIEHRMMYLDLVSYLPDDILVKVDRAAMSVSLETRAPFLDHRVVEFVARLPRSLKIQAGQGKSVLRDVLYRYVPRALVERPKAGFAVPIGDWLRGPLRDWAEALLSESRLRGEGFLDPSAVRTKWQEHVSGRRNWQHHLWDVLMFQSWLEESRKSEVLAPPAGLQ
jgi:asparagine synthase (glutamine-hydrolysing)